MIQRPSGSRVGASIGQKSCATASACSSQRPLSAIEAKRVGHQPGKKCSPRRRHRAGGRSAAPATTGSRPGRGTRRGCGPPPHPGWGPITSTGLQRRAPSTSIERGARTPAPAGCFSSTGLLPQLAYQVPAWCTTAAPCRKPVPPPRRGAPPRGSPRRAGGCGSTAGKGAAAPERLRSLTHVPWSGYGGRRALPHAPLWTGPKKASRRAMPGHRFFIVFHVTE